MRLKPFFATCGNPLRGFDSLWLAAVSRLRLCDGERHYLCHRPAPQDFACFASCGSHRYLLLDTRYSLLTTHYSLLATLIRAFPCAFGRRGVSNLLTTRYSLLTTHYSLLATHYSLLATHYSLLYYYLLLATCYSDSSIPLRLRTTRGLESTHYSLLTTCYSLLTTHYSLLATRYSLLTTRYSLLATRYSLLATHYSLLATRYWIRLNISGLIQSLLTLGQLFIEYRFQTKN